MAGYSRSSGIGSKNDTRLRRAVAAMSQRPARHGSSFLIDGGLVVQANALSLDGYRFQCDGIFVEYVINSSSVFTVSIDSGVRTVFILSDPTTLGRILDVTYNDLKSRYELCFYSTYIQALTCDMLYADSGDFDYVRINATSGPPADIPASGECVVYMQTSGGVDYLRAKFKSGAVREIANSSHTLVQFDGIGISGGIPAAGEIAFDTAGTIYSGGGLLTGDLTLACYGVTGDIVLSPVDQVVINGDTLVITTSKTPSGAFAEGDEGQFAWDDDYLYVRVSDRWKRIALSVFSVAVLAVDGTEVSVDGTAIGVDQ